MLHKLWGVLEYMQVYTIFPISNLWISQTSIVIALWKFICCIMSYNIN